MESGERTTIITVKWTVGNTEYQGIVKDIIYKDYLIQQEDGTQLLIPIGCCSVVSAESIQTIDSIEYFRGKLLWDF